MRLESWKCLIMRLGLLASMPSGCTISDPLYCESDRQCTDPARPFCDFNGEHSASEGIKRTCIPAPGDAGTGIDDAGLPDASPNDGKPEADASSRCQWGRFSRLANVNTRDNESLGSLDADGLTLYLGRYDSAGNSDIFVATRATTGEAFGVPTEVVELRDDELLEYGPEISSAERELFYATGLGIGYIHTAVREDATSTFSAPVPLDFGGFHPSLSGDGLHLYVVRGEVVVRYDRATIGGTWSGPTSVLPGSDYVSVEVAPDELRLLLTNEDTASPLLISERGSLDEDFGPPVPVDLSILPPNTAPIEATWNGDQTQMVISAPVAGFGWDLFYSTCR